MVDLDTPIRRQRRWDGPGQTLVEFALVMPVFLVLMLGFAELAMMFATRQGYQNGVDVLVDWAAEEMYTSSGESWKSGWGKVVREEAERAKCSDTSPSVTFPDGSNKPGDRVLVSWTCRYEPHVAPGWGGIDITVESGAVVPGFTPTAAPSSPAPSPS